MPHFIAHKAQQYTLGSFILGRPRNSGPVWRLHFK